MKCSLSSCAWLAFCAASLLCAQQPQTPPPQPPAGAANGPQPGPAVQPPGPGDRTSTPQSRPPVPGGHGDFLAIGPLADPVVAARGQQTFIANCAFCHGSNASGGNGGPDLVRSVLVLHDKGSGAEVGPVILKGRTAKGMPAFPTFTEAQIKDIATFLLSRSQATANRMEYKILNIVTGDPKAGEAYFTAHCAHCHSATGDLAHIAGKFEPVDLQARFLYPREPRNRTAPAAANSRAVKTATVTLASGQSVSGRVAYLDDFSISLVDNSGVHHSWLFEEEKGIKVDVHDPLQEHADLLTRYSNTDMHNILAYLETLK